MEFVVGEFDGGDCVVGEFDGGDCVGDGEESGVVNGAFTLLPLMSYFV